MSETLRNVFEFTESEQRVLSLYHMCGWGALELEPRDAPPLGNMPGFFFRDKVSLSGPVGFDLVTFLT